MVDYMRLVWFVGGFSITYLISFYSLQALDFSKLFKKNSTWQINVLIIVISIALGFSVAIGLDSLIIIFKDLKK